MASSPESENQKEQQHPLASTDRMVVDALLQGEPTDYNLAELARLRIRYDGFPGAKEVKSDLDKILNRWDLTESELFAKTRQIHQTAQVYKGRGSQREDWS